MRTKILLRGALLSGLATGGVYELSDTTPASAAPTTTNAPEVPVARVVVREVAPSVEVTGRTRAVSEVALRARVPGYREAVAFTEGAMVRKGQLLFSSIRGHRRQRSRVRRPSSRARSTN